MCSEWGKGILLIKNNIILTFDYELFLGEDTGDIYNSLINPTNKILSILNTHKSRGLFFIDATFLTVLKNYSEEYFIIVKKQIMDMVQKGHDIGLHIHPHWLDSELISECRWRFKSYERYRLHSLDKDLRPQLVTQAYLLLKNIVSEVNPDYSIDSFRAGGWCIQPFSEISDLLKEIGIRYDFSVIPNQRSFDLPKHYYDYRKVPTNKTSWHFSNDVIIEDKHGELIEVPVTILTIKLIDFFINRLRIKKNVYMGDGKGAATPKTFLEKLMKITYNVPQLLSSDSFDKDILNKYLINKNDNLLVYVAHPKLFSENSFEILSHLSNSYKTIDYRKIAE